MKSLKKEKQQIEIKKNLIEEEKKNLDLLNTDLKKEIEKMKEGVTELTLNEIKNLNVTFQLTDRSKRPMKLKDVQFVEWRKNWGTIYVSDCDKFEVRGTIEQFFDRYLHGKLFVQVHKSFVVNAGNVEKFQANKVIMKNLKSINVPLGKKYKSGAVKFMEELL